MDRTGTILQEQFSMQLCSVAFMFCKLILGIQLINLHHQTISTDLCQNRSGSNAVTNTMLMIVAAEYFGLAKEIFDAFKETYDIAFRDALASVPDFLTEAEIRTSVLKDLGIAFVFSILEAVFFIRDAVRKSKAAAAAETEAAAKNPAEF